MSCQQASGSESSGGPRLALWSLLFRHIGHDVMASERLILGMPSAYLCRSAMLRAWVWPRRQCHKARCCSAVRARTALAWCGRVGGTTSGAIIEESAAGRESDSCSEGVGTINESVKSSPRMDSRPKVIVRLQLEQSMSCMDAVPSRRSE